MYMNYKSMIAPFLDTLNLQTEQSKHTYMNRINECITLLETGGFERPGTEYFSALEAHLFGNLAKSTANNRLSIARRFFTWVLEQQEGEEHIPLTNTEPFTATTTYIDEEAPCLNFEHEEGETVQAVESVEAQTGAPVLPNVEATDAKSTPETIEQPAHPHEEHSEELEHSTCSKPPKLTVYPSFALEADIKDLASIDGMPVSKFILKLIEHEVQERKEDLNIIRRLRAKRA